LAEILTKFQINLYEVSHWQIVIIINNNSRIIFGIAGYVNIYHALMFARQKWTHEILSLKQNVVLITDDKIPRGRWRLGKIEQTFPGADGLVRTVRILTKQGYINRPVQRLHLLEDHRNASSQVPHSASSNVPQIASSQALQNPSSSKIKRVKNGSSPLQGENVQSQERVLRTRSGRVIKPCKRFKQ
jgi:hypothetical protein